MFPYFFTILKFDNLNWTEGVYCMTNYLSRNFIINGKYTKWLEEEMVLIPLV